ncbi:hypothetical protein ACLI36_35095, partial [Pseudomonas aeruginosa]
PRRMGGASAEEHVARSERRVGSIVGQGARWPAQRRFEARERSVRDGVTIPEALHRELLALLEGAQGEGPTGQRGAARTTA